MLGRWIASLLGVNGDGPHRSQGLAGPDEAWFRQIAANVPAALIGVDRDERVRLWTSECAVLFARDRDVIGEDLEQVGGAFAAGSRLRSLIQDALRGRAPADIEMQAVDGTRILDLLARAFAIRDESGAVHGAVVACVDLSEQRRIQRDLQANNARLAAAVQDRTLMLARQEEDRRHSQKMEALGRLAGGVAHDFNNLLTVISTHAALLDRPDRDPAERVDLQAIREATARGAQLTRQLLAVSRRNIPQPVSFDFNDAVHEILQLLDRILGENVQVIADLSGDLGDVQMDRGQLEQVLMNLALNARDAMPEGGTLRVSTSRLLDPLAQGITGPGILLAVGDTGVGMDRRTQLRMFEPYFTTKDKGDGTGLGLATVYGIVQQLGGTIRVASAPGAGTRFEIALPRVAASDEPTTDSGLIRAGPANSVATLLFVEDERGIRRVVRRALESAGYRVLSAASPREALKLAAEFDGEIGALVTDIVLPGMDGLQLAQALRALRPTTRVLLVSGFASLTSSDTDLPLLPKPFQPQDLVRAVRDVLKKPAA